ncbi:MAG: peptidylprolyl isomerase [Bacteroidetes bacterium]|nr:MAG: peptidylprolyl isomerase [Bacteroidota bacterium]
MLSASGCDNVASSKGPKKVVIHTDFGDMVVLLSDSTPQHRDNFIKLAEEGFYDGLLFHRVMSDFMIQGGDPKSKGAEKGVRLGSGGPGYTIPNEMRSDHLHVKGALAAARQPDSVNPDRNSSGSQFYIVQGGKYKEGELKSFEMRHQATNPDFRYSDKMKTAYLELGGYAPLDLNYTVFGYVIEGLDIIDSIAAVKTDRSDRPLEDVKFSIEVIK